MATTTIQILKGPLPNSRIGHLTSTIRKNPNFAAKHISAAEGMDTLDDGLSQLQSAIVPSITIPVTTTTQVLEVTAVNGTTTNITTTFSPTAGGAVLFVFVSQDATGGGQITWDTTFNFVSAPIVNINTLPNAVTVFQFAPRTPSGGSLGWWLVGVPAM